MESIVSNAEVEVPIGASYMESIVGTSKGHMESTVDVFPDLHVLLELLACRKYVGGTVVIPSAAATAFVWFGNEFDMLLMCFLECSCFTKTLPSFSNLVGCHTLVGQFL